MADSQTISPTAGVSAAQPTISLRWPTFEHLEEVVKLVGCSDSRPPAYLREPRILATHVDVRFVAVAVEFESLMIYIRRSLVLAESLSQDVLDEALATYSEAKTAMEASIRLLSIYAGMLPDSEYPTFRDVQGSADWSRASRIRNRANLIVDSLNAPARLHHLRAIYRQRMTAIAEWRQLSWEKSKARHTVIKEQIIPDFKNPESIADRDRMGIDFCQEWQDVAKARDEAKDHLEDTVRQDDMAEDFLAALEPGKILEIYQFAGQINNYLGHMIDIVDPSIRRYSQSANDWTSQKFQLLKELLPAPRPVMSAPETPNMTLTQRQLSENQCGICWDEYQDATSTPCQHVFCFECVVPHVRDNRTCPLCRRSMNIGDLCEIYPLE